MRAGEKAQSCGPPRVGRPPTEAVGEVEARILDAAAEVFLTRGFDGASVDRIAETARAGKPTIYARYPNKAALFEAAFLRRFAARTARLEMHRPFGASLEARLICVGIALVEESLSEDFVGLLRLAVTGASRCPKLASGLMKQARERGAETIARLLFEAADSSNPHARKAAEMFAESMLLPFLMRALAHEDLTDLRKDAEAHVKSRAAFFVAALRNDGLNSA